MEHEIYIEILLKAVAVLCVLVAGMTVWLASYMRKTSDRVIKISNEAADSMEASVEAIASLLKEQLNRDK